MTIQKFKIYIAFVIFFLLLFPQFSVYAQEVPADYQGCVPNVTKFSASPTNLPKRDSNVKLTVTFQTDGCIIPGSGDGSKWGFWVRFIDDNGQPYPDGYGLHYDSFIRGSDFKRLGTNPTNANYNKYVYTKTYSADNPFVNQTGKTITLRPGTTWAGNPQYKFPSLDVKITVSDATNANSNKNNNKENNSSTNTTPPNNSKNNSQINTGISADLKLNLDENLGKFFNPLVAQSVPELITSIIRVLFLLVSIAAVIVIIIAGFRMVLASGNQDQLTKAKKAITWAILGLIVSLMSFSIVSIIQNLISRANSN